MFFPLDFFMSEKKVYPCQAVSERRPASASRSRNLGVLIACLEEKEQDEEDEEGGRTRKKEEDEG